MSDLDTYLQGKPYTLTSEQYNYCNDVIYGDKHVSNFSGSGCGKSLCLEIIKDVLGDRCVVCSTTGISNSILFNNKGGAGTASSVWSLPLGLHNTYHEKKVGKNTSNLFSSSDLVTTVIIDEAGMLNVDQLVLIFKRIKRFNRAYGKKRKARNIKLVLSGDFLQIPPIYTWEEARYMRDNYGSEHLFLSDVYKEAAFSVHIFTENKRAGYHVFQEALDVLRYGQEHRYDGVIKWFNKRFLPAPNDCVRVATTNARVNELNKEALNNNPNPLVVIDAVLEGPFDIKGCPADQKLEIKVNAPIISLMNSQNGEFFNGSFGYIRSIIVGEGVIVEFLHSGKEELVPYFTYEQTEYFTNEDEYGNPFMDMKITAKCTQLAIKVCAAMTVNRCQGRSIDVPMELDLGTGFSTDPNNSYGQAIAYVGISRLTNINNLYLRRRLTKRHIKTNDVAINYVLENMGY